MTDESQPTRQTIAKMLDVAGQLRAVERSTAMVDAHTDLAWIGEVLDDLSLFASMNGLQRLRENVDLARRGWLEEQQDALSASPSPFSWRGSAHWGKNPDSREGGRPTS